MVNRTLKARIIERFGNQVEFSRKIGASEPLISRVLHGYATLDKDERKRWALVLGAKSPKRLFNY